VRTDPPSTWDLLVRTRAANQRLTRRLARKGGRVQV
jgi:hypothetical protein